MDAVEQAQAVIRRSLVLDTRVTLAELRKRLPSFSSNLLNDYLDGLRKANPAISVNVIAHSMGSLVTIEAMQQGPSLFANVSHVVMLAPDIPLDDRRERELLSAVRATASTQLHVLFSRNDDVLSGAHGERTAERCHWAWLDYRR